VERRRRGSQCQKGGRGLTRIWSQYLQSLFDSQGPQDEPFQWQSGSKGKAESPENRDSRERVYLALVGL
jgi:hypothetical protein